MDAETRAQSENDSSEGSSPAPSPVQADTRSDESVDSGEIIYIDANTAESAGMVPKHGKLVLKAKMDVPKCFEGDTYMMKLPGFISMETTAFDPEKFKAECALNLDEEGRERMKLKNANCIRWREVYDENGEYKGIQSNTQWVDWSDGTSSLCINGEYFHLKKEELPFDIYFGEVKKNRIDVYNKYKGKMSFEPLPLESHTHQNICTDIVERSLKKKGAKHCSPSKDPVDGFGNKLKAEMQKLRKPPSKKPPSISKKKNLHARTVLASTEDTEEDIDFDFGYYNYEDEPLATTTEPPVAAKEAPNASEDSQSVCGTRKREDEDEILATTTKPPVAAEKSPNASEDSDSDFGTRKRKTDVKFFYDSDD